MPLMQEQLHLRRKCKCITDARAIASSMPLMQEQVQLHLRRKCKCIADARAIASQDAIAIASAMPLMQVHLRRKCKCIADAIAIASAMPPMQVQLHLRRKCKCIADARAIASAMPPMQVQVQTQVCNIDSFSPTLHFSLWPFLHCPSVQLT
jgi:hypothetical protein